MAEASHIRDTGHGFIVTYSPKVFIPLTRLCRDTCRYCTFAETPRPGVSGFLKPEEVLDIAREGVAAGCAEALFTLGDKPELRYHTAAQELQALGFRSTLDYLYAIAGVVARETRLLPHINAGVMNAHEISSLREVSASQGLMLESTAARLCLPGGPHFGSPDKSPDVRLAMIEAAGEAAVPFTSGILIGIGETRAERVDALVALKRLHDRYGHIQEIIIQNFRAKPSTIMANATEPTLNDHLWTVAVARIIFGPDMSIQAPPNLQRSALVGLINAGINDWGGISTTTIDHVNPEYPWPTIRELEAATSDAGKTLHARLTIYPQFALQPNRWLAGQMRTLVLERSDSEGLAREGKWMPGASVAPPTLLFGARSRNSGLTRTLARAAAGNELSEKEIVELFSARGPDVVTVCNAADELRRKTCGDRVSYVVTRNINYTNICSFRCKFCAFSKGKLSDNLRGKPYNLDLEEIVRRTTEAWGRGAVEVCLQGGIHPEYSGKTYLKICRAIKSAVPEIHVHAFSPLEIWQGAATLRLPVREYLQALKEAGLGSLPGTAAEILDDEVRSIICPDKVTTSQWLEVVETAHEVGLRSTVTIMFGHVDRPQHWARHLLRVRHLQERTGGFTEFVPLPFIPMETPLHRAGRCRLGPTFREALLMHAVARLALHPAIQNIQTSWVKMGPDGAQEAISAGVNDMGGTLMNESIGRAAGAQHGQELTPRRMEELIKASGRLPWQRTTLYREAPSDRRAASFAEVALT